MTLQRRIIAVLVIELTFFLKKVIFVHLRDVVSILLDSLEVNQFIWNVFPIRALSILIF
jgi:hypothetical protein